jgi:hypothetical protein
MTEAFIMTRIAVGDYDEWKQAFDRDVPEVRRAASAYRLFCNVDDRSEVFIQVEFDSCDEAKAGRDRLLASGVLDRFEDRTGPTVVAEAEAVTY